MAEASKGEDSTALGRIQILQDESPPRNLAGLPLPSQIYEWTPAPALTAHLPADFSLRLRCVTGGDGVRRFYPVNHLDGFIPLAFIAGLELLAAQRNLTPEQRNSYRVMFLLFQRVRRTREHLGNNLLNATSLRLSRVGRDLADERSILPETVGLDDQGRGEPWSVDRLLAEGRTAAREAGIASPTEADCVRYGLTVAARRNPLTIPAHRVPELVRNALYDEPAADEKLEPEVFDAIVERILAALWSHLTEPASAFNAWFSGGNNSLVGQVARRKLPRGGRLDQKVVRRVLAELGWEAYRHVADCVVAIMRAFETLIPEPLTDLERAWWEAAYLNQPAFANLPFVLLHDRFPFLKPVISEILDDPTDDQAIAVLHRLLDWYGDLARRRRQVDRVTKQRRPARRVKGEKTPLTVSLPGQEATEEADENDEAAETDVPETGTLEQTELMELFQDIAAEICQQRQLQCGCGLQDWHHLPLSASGDRVTIQHTCGACQFTATSTVSIEDVRQAALQAREGQPGHPRG